MSAPEYFDERASDLVRLIKDGAVFLRPVGSTPVESTAWDGSAFAAYMLGYYSEDGLALTPNPGNESVFPGHNGDELLTDQLPGFWTFGVSPLEANEKVVSAYLDTDPESDGSYYVTSAAASKEYNLVIAGVDQADRLIVAEAPRVKINAREAITLNRQSLMMYGMTFRTFKHAIGSTQCHFHAFGLVVDEDDASSSSSAEESSSSSA